MSNDWFFEKFALIADAHGAVERMRELVLHLAVRGQLVPREYRDSSASEQLAELQPSVLEPPHRFDTPENWIWVPLDPLLSKMKNGYNGKPNKSGGCYKVTRIETIARGTIDTNRVGFADGLTAEVVEKHLIAKGDILFSHINSEPHLGKTAICTSNDTTLIHGVNLLLLRTNPQINPQYLNTVFKELRVAGYFISIAQRAINQSSINQKNLGKTPIPLPPLAEQKRIVAKVDELMGICDALEAQQRERESRKSVLVRASLSRFAESPTPENLDYLFHKSYDIPPSELRKSILTLAVQGKLVPQDPNDEPAESILMKIENEKKRLCDTGGMKADKKVWINSSTTPPHKIPDSWLWVRLQDVFEISRGGSPRPAGDPRYFGGSCPWITVGELTNNSCKYLTETATGLTKEGSERSRFINPGDLLLTNSGATLGVPKISKIRGCINDGVAVLRLFHLFNLNDFGYLYLTQQTQAFRSVNQGMGQPNLNTPIIAGWFFPVPPLAEQHRIVAKVDQLMALVDELERQQETSREKASKLLDAIVQEMTSGGRDIAATLES